MINHEDQPRQSAIAEIIQYNWHSKESDLVSWWLRQSEHMDDLQTMAGEHLIVLDAGQQNDGPGPDIYRSHFILDDIEMSGTVEMHSKASDWFVHGHHNDIKYENVALHVVVEATGGPDIPMLTVDRNWLGASRCLAQRSVSQGDLMGRAFIRFKRKEQHINSLLEQGQGYSPLLLGMIEIIMAGASRTRQLPRAASLLGLERWPDIQVWRGSNLTFRKKQLYDSFLELLLDNRSLFLPQKWAALDQNSWSGWDSICGDFHRIGIKRNDCREWIVNILAPFRGEEWGFRLWQEMKVFRHYGLEKRMLGRLGLSGIASIAGQQGVLGWKNTFCSQASCANCPLTQYHHTLTHVN